jgi:outer membrane murein-binding lipoprotein Lpp
VKRALYLLVGVILVAFSTGARAQETPTPPEATIAAYATQVSQLNEQIDKLQTSVAKRDAKIDEQRARIAELKEEVETLEGQLPPTPTPTPELSGKDAYPYVTNAQELFTRPHNHLGTKVSFCGRVGYIEVARPGYVFTPGDSVSTSWATVAQVFLDGVDVQFMVGFDGDTNGIYEDSYVCVWGTLVDTMSGTNSFGGTIVNPLFDAEYFELA